MTNQTINQTIVDDIVSKLQGNYEGSFEDCWNETTAAHGYGVEYSPETKKKAKGAWIDSVCKQSRY